MGSMQIESFSDIGEKFRAEMEEYGKIVSFDRESDPFDYDETLENFFFILSGKIKIFQMNLKNGKEQTIYLMSRGDMYDTVVLLDGREHDLMCEVLEAGEAISVPVSRVREWMYRYPMFGEMVLKYVASQVRRVESIASDLTLLDTRERLIKLLVENLERSRITGMNILDNLSHAEIAKLIGTVRHVVDRHIKQLKEEGILDSGRKRLSLKNMQKLKKKLEELG